MTFRDAAKNLDRYTPLALRGGIALILFYFGISQLMDVEGWTIWVPAFFEQGPVSLETIVIMNGIFEIVTATLVLIGLWTRPVAALITLHLAVITLSIGWTAIGVRDAGLALMSLAHFFEGPDEWSLDAYFAKKKRG